MSPTTTSSQRLVSNTPKQLYPDDFDYDDVTVGKTLLDARRRRADHSEEDGLSSCLASSVSYDRTWRPVVCSLGSQVSRRTLAPWPITSLPQVMSPTTTSSQRLVSNTPEQLYPDDFDYDDVTVGKTLLDARRRRADHSEEDGLSSCLASSVSYDRTWRPVVCSLGSQVSSAQETQRHNFESEQIRSFLERQREQKTRIPGR